MIYLDKATKNWKTDGAWKIAPAGLDWIKEGSYIQVGEWSRIGARSTIGEWSRIGARSRIGEGSTIGEGSRIGARSRIGEWSRIGARSTIGEWSRIGEGSRIGEKSNEAIDLGWADGYRKCIAQVDGVAYIGAGCRWFTLADALKHWDKKDDRVLTMCLMQSAIYIARYKGWSHE